jgi:CubicO group peptidase (beta-lactamase class C family)/dienelactone hydrolase
MSSLSLHTSRLKSGSPITIRPTNDAVRWIAIAGFLLGAWQAMVVIACAAQADGNRAGTATAPASPSWDWATASPESAGMDPARLEAAWVNLARRQTTSFVVVRHDKIVFERYAAGYSRARPHGTASMAKALVGGVTLMLAMNDGRIRPDDLASKYVPAWRNDAQRSKITIRHLATHTSGIEDAELDDMPHEKLTGWKGDFWKRLPPPNDPFSIARDRAPVLDLPGKEERYSNPGMAMLGYCVTASLRGGKDSDLRSLLRHRIMEPLGVAPGEWSVGYGTVSKVDGLSLVATWGGGAYSPNATARVGRLMLHGGNWEGRQLISPSVVRTATTNSGLPEHSGLAWWVNKSLHGGKPWKSAPEDAFGGAGAKHQFLLVVPSLHLIVVRNGEQIDNDPAFWAGLERYVITPVMQAVVPSQGSSQVSSQAAPYPPSPVIKSIQWAPKETIVRQAQDSDNWPVTWADDGSCYTAYGDGYGFEPKISEKLSLGFARVTGGPADFRGVNIRSATGEQHGNGAKGKKASGILMTGGVIYLWVRNAGNSQLAWSPDHGQTWHWCDWKFTASFGCPTFLNFGKDYAGARDEYVYVYSPDSDNAYVPADRMVLARAPKARIREREAYEFFTGLDGGKPRWSVDIAQRGAVFRYDGKCYRSGISYDAGLKRYLWCQTLPGGDARIQGGFGIYDAPEPWGPWTTVYYTQQWDVGPGESSSFPTKWMTADGKTLYLVFSGDDNFSVRKAILEVADRTELARTLVSDMAAGRFDQAVGLFDPTMKQALPADQLKEAWDGLGKQYGAFQRATGARTEKIRQYEVVYVMCEFQRAKLETKVVFTSENKVTGLFFVTAERYRPPAYADSAKFEEKEIEVGSRNWRLPGTLSLPKGSGPFPAVVLVHGSGPNDRDETIGPNKPFRDLAQGLASRGIAVLRYEKRTKHYPFMMALSVNNITVKEEAIDDAVATAEVLASQEKIDPRRIFVLGHSLGGSLLPRIGEAEGKIAGFISLAGSTRPLEDLLLEQTRYIVSLSGKPSPEEQKQIALLEEQVALIKSPRLSADTPMSQLPLGVPAKYWLDLRGYEPAKAAASLAKPMLILQGERDYQVTMEDFGGWKKRLGSRTDVTFISYPRLNHLFLDGKGRSTPAEYLVAGNIAPAVIDDIVKWIIHVSKA